MSHPTIDNRLVQASLAVKSPAIRVPEVHGEHISGLCSFIAERWWLWWWHCDGVSDKGPPCNASAGIFHNNWRDAKDIKCRNLLLMVKYITKYLHYKMYNTKYLYCKIYNTKYLHYKLYNTQYLYYKINNTKHLHVCICISISFDALTMITKTHPLEHFRNSLSPPYLYLFSPQLPCFIFFLYICNEYNVSFSPQLSVNLIICQWPGRFLWGCNGQSTLFLQAQHRGPTNPGVLFILFIKNPQPHKPLSNYSDNDLPGTVCQELCSYHNNAWAIFMTIIYLALFARGCAVIITILEQFSWQWFTWHCLPGVGQSPLKQ